MNITAAASRVIKPGACFLLFACASFFVNAQTDEKKGMSLNVSLNSDVFFGFYPAFSGSYPVSDKVDFTAYGILWSGGVGEGWGNWTEFGVGANIKPAAGLSINPQLGLLSGGLLSAGLAANPVLGDGIVPNLTVREITDKFEAELYAGYYHGFRHGNVNTNNYLHWWINGGYRFTSLLSFGVHFEHLRFTGGEGRPSDAAVDLFQALGPYVQFTDPRGKGFARFSAGGDLRPDAERTRSGNNLSSFFKLTVGYAF